MSDPFFHSTSSPDSDQDVLPCKFSSCLGVIAGSGHLVQQVIDTCETSRQPFFILAFEGQTDPTLIKNRSHAWVKTGKVGKSIAILKQAKVTHLVMAGRFTRPAWHELQPDMTGLKWIAQLAPYAYGDDKLLTMVIKLLEAEGFIIIAPEEIIRKNLFIAKGVAGKIYPSKEALQDIKRGKEILQAISPLDIGQSIVIQQGLTLGIEAIEGTDELILRTGQYKRSGMAPTLIKMCKQGQETRIDRPTVGINTLKNLKEAGFAGLAVESNNVIVLDQASFLAYADEAGLFITGI